MRWPVFILSLVVEEHAYSTEIYCGVYSGKNLLWICGGYATTCCLDTLEQVVAITMSCPETSDEQVSQHDLWLSFPSTFWDNYCCVLWGF